jgi:hypothetical protein
VPPGPCPWAEWDNSWRPPCSFPPSPADVVPLVRDFINLFSGSLVRPWWSDRHQGSVRLLASVPGWFDRHQGRSDRQHLQQMIFLEFLPFPPWQSDYELHCSLTELCRIFPMASFWSVGYKYSSNSCKTSLLVISIAYLTLERPLLPHTSIPWVCEILMHDLSVLELCGTSDSSSKHHLIVTLGGCHLLDSLEEWKP